MISEEWECGIRPSLTDSDIGWLIGQLRESLEQTAYYKTKLERLEREGKK